MKWIKDRLYTLFQSHYQVDDYLIQTDNILLMPLTPTELISILHEVKNILDGNVATEDQKQEIRDLITEIHPIFTDEIQAIIDMPLENSR